LYQHSRLEIVTLVQYWLGRLGSTSLPHYDINYDCKKVLYCRPQV